MLAIAGSAPVAAQGRGPLPGPTSADLHGELGDGEESEQVNGLGIDEVGLNRADLGDSLRRDLPTRGSGEEADPLPFDPADISSHPFGVDPARHPRVVHWIRYFSENARGHRRLAGWMRASGRYADMIVEECRRQNAPEELLWLVAVESGFNLVAESHAGAAGLWQFMPRTARGRGMRVDDIIDERLDPEIATRMGIAYIVRQQERFGDWMLAFAAYNAGRGHVRSGMREANANGFEAVDQREAVYTNARDYASRIVAIATIANHPHLFGFDDVIRDDAITWDTVRLPEGVRLSLVADAAGVTTEEIIALNPSLVRRTTEFDPTTVRIPAGTFEAFVAAYDQVAERYGEEHELVQLRFGETLDQLSARVGVPARVLRAINGLRGGTHAAYGDELLVPTRGRRSLSDEATRADVVVPPDAFAPLGRRRVFYRVQRGDTLSEIAANFGVTAGQLANWNAVDADSALLSQTTLQLWIAPDFDLSGSVVIPEEEANVYVFGSEAWQAWQESSEEQQHRRRERHTVSAGETLLGIARRHGVSSADLMRWNDLEDADRIRIGQELIVSP